MPGIDSYTKLMLHMNGVDGSTTFTDSSADAHSMTASGDAQIDTAQSKFGSASGLFDGTGDYVSSADFADLDLGSGDFTFDAWVRFSDVTKSNVVCGRHTSGTSYFYWQLTNGSNGMRFVDYNSSAYVINMFASPSFSNNTWYHVAIVRTGNDFKFFVDGTQVGSTYNSSSALTARAVGLDVGALLANSAYRMNGWIDEFRFSPGVARWTSNFTPPSEEYTVELTADINDSIELEDTWEILTNPDSADISDTISLVDTWSSVLFHKINLTLDLRWFNLVANNMSLFLSWLLKKSVTLDLRWLGLSQKSVNTDFRWLSSSYISLTPINYTDIQILVNGVDILAANDIDIQSGKIIHTIGQNSQASFTLARKHDDLDRTHLGVASQITNQNAIQIYIDGHLEFDGYVMTINAESESETVAITAQMTQPQDNRHSIELPLPSVNEKLHLYHCLVNSVSIDNPKEDTRAVIIGNNNRYWTGSAWTYFIEDAMLFATDVDAQNYINAYVDLSVNQTFVSKEPSVTSREKNPQYYKGIKVNLGKEITQQVDRYTTLETIYSGKGITATKIENGTFVTKPNYSYFWSVLAKNAVTGQTNVDYRYIGTSLASTTTDLWVLNGVVPRYQRIKENLETELGYYYLGSAPFKEISPKNSRLITSEKWIDAADGLYNVLEESYNYESYAKIVAGLEYDKLKNINGDILPITAANLAVTLDAYYFYNIKLLTRINVTNTTISDIYKNLNGFPVSVKSINIDLSNMKVSLATDNKLSQIEIDALDAQMPLEEDYIVPEQSSLIYRKFDLKTWKFVS